MTTRAQNPPTTNPDRDRRWPSGLTGADLTKALGETSATDPSSEIAPNSVKSVAGHP
jgi:hypothetical protein